VPSCSVTNTITVQTTADEGDGIGAGTAGPDGVLSLREALHEAGLDSELSKVVVPAGTYALTMGELAPSTPDCTLLVQGAGARVTTIDAARSSRIFNIGPSALQTGIADVTLTRGSAASGNGGAIFSDTSPLTLDHVTVRDSSAQDSGGGVAAFGALTVTNSTISGNRASPLSNPSASEGRGGGIYSEATLKVIDSTISGNMALTGSSGDGVGGGVWSNSSVDVRSSTLADNSTSGGSGGNVNASPTFTTENSLFAGGTPNNCSTQASSNSSGDLSLSTDTTCVGVAARQSKGGQLGPLIDNGGPTDTRALLAGNAAIDGGEDIACDGTDISSITSDQRGLGRPQGPSCDVGAYELVQNATLSIGMTAAPNPVGLGKDVTYTMTVHSNGPAIDATQPVVTDHVPAGATFVSATPSQGTCTGGATVSCSLGTLANGSDATVTLVLKTTAAGALANTAAESSPRPDVSLNDDQATATVAVKGKPVCTLTHGSSKLRKKPKPGAVRLTALCDQDATLRLAGKLRVKAKKKGKKKPKVKTLTLKAIHGSAKANVPRKLAVKLPKAAVKALKKGAKESASFTLTATSPYGTDQATAKIAKLKKP
jgi:uncharacterized repeat protein (TIGR01451 family)